MFLFSEHCLMSLYSVISFVKISQMAMEWTRFETDRQTNNYGKQEFCQRLCRPLTDPNSRIYARVVPNVDGQTNKWTNRRKT